MRIRTKEEKPLMRSELLCPRCDSSKVKPYGHYRGRKRFRCESCARTFNELTGASISGTHFPDKWQDFLDCMVAGKSVRYSAEKLGVSIPTAFSWRHKILKKYEKEADKALLGIVEADETFFLFSEKGDKTVSKRRKSRKRGGKAKKAGVSDEQVPVIAGCDRDGNVILGVAGRGRISMADVEEVLNDYIGDEITLCTDAHSSFKAYAKAYKFSYVGLNISSGKRIVRKKYHIQNVNNFHSRLKQWIARFNGVSTKYLQNYMNWFSLLEETKHDLKAQVEKFTHRSIPLFP
jgi:transposase-like protein